MINLKKGYNILFFSLQRFASLTAINLLSSKPNKQTYNYAKDKIKKTRVTEPNVINQTIQPITNF